MSLQAINTNSLKIIFDKNKSWSLLISPIYFIENILIQISNQGTINRFIIEKIMSQITVILSQKSRKFKNTNAQKVIINARAFSLLFFVVTKPVKITHNIQITV
jgi:hypothetical protein